MSDSKRPVGLVADVSSSIHFPNESPEYRAARERLLAREVELRRLTEAVARERRALPAGGLPPEDYEFEGEGAGGAPTTMRLSALFDGKPTLAIYSYMFSPDWETPCNMCTPLLDGLDAVGTSLAQRFSFVVVAESPLPKLLAFARARGWRHNRLLSSAGTTYNRDYHGKSTSGADSTMLNVFRRLEDGTVRHFWGTEMAWGPSDPGQDMRALDPLNPIFNFLDFTPEGRGDFRTKIDYPSS